MGFRGCQNTCGGRQVLPRLTPGKTAPGLFFNKVWLSRNLVFFGAFFFARSIFLDTIEMSAPGKTPWLERRAGWTDSRVLPGPQPADDLFQGADGPELGILLAVQHQGLEASQTRPVDRYGITLGSPVGLQRGH